MKQRTLNAFKYSILLITMVISSTTFAMEPRVTGDISPDFDFNISCRGETVQFLDLSNTTSGNISSWLWRFGDVDNTTSSIQQPQFSYDSAGTYDVTLVVMDDEGGIDSITQVVLVLDKPDARMISKEPCFPNSIELTSTSSFRTGSIVDLEWIVGGSSYTTDIVNFMPPAAGLHPFELVVRGDNGCNDTIKGDLNSPQSPTISTLPSESVGICEGDTARLTVNGDALNYTWNTGETGQNIETTQPDEYIVFGFATDECFASDTVDVFFESVFFLTAGPDLEIYPGDSITLEASTSTSNTLWYPNIGLSDTSAVNPLAGPVKTTYYIFRGTNDAGCVIEDTMLLTILDPTDIEVRNAISPNGDGENDFWNLSNLPGIDEAQVIVLNRYGIEVFNQEKYKNKWDGSFEGNPLPEGTYVYLIIWPERFEREIARGTLEIIR